MTSLVSSTPYPPSTVAYRHVNKILDALLSEPVFLTLSTFTLPTSTVMSTTSATTISSSPFPPISLKLSSATIHAAHSTAAPLPLLPEDAVARLSHHQQLSVVRQLTQDLQQRKPRHPKRPQLPPGEAGTLTKRIVDTAIYKQKLNHHKNALKLYELYNNQLLYEQATELDKITNIVNAIVNKSQIPSKSAKFKSSLTIPINCHHSVSISLQYLP